MICEYHYIILVRTFKTGTRMVRSGKIFTYSRCTLPVSLLINLTPPSPCSEEGKAEIARIPSTGSGHAEDKLRTVDFSPDNNSGFIKGFRKHYEFPGNPFF